MFCVVYVVTCPSLLPFCCFRVVSFLWSVLESYITCIEVPSLAESMMFLAPAGLLGCDMVHLRAFGSKSKIAVLHCCRNARVVSACPAPSHRDSPATMESGAHGAPSRKCDRMMTLGNLARKEKGKNIYWIPALGQLFCLFIFLKFSQNTLWDRKSYPPLIDEKTD